jgi:hypothetical protein
VADRRRSGVVGGAAPTGAGDENLRHHKLDEPLANPRTKKEERQSQFFTGGKEITTTARNRGGGAGKNWCSSACSGVLRVQRGGRELELELK